MFKEYKNQSETLLELLRAYCQCEEGKDKASKEALSKYLNEQDMEFVKWVQVVIHLGCNPQEGTPEEVYRKTMQAFNLLKGWRPQEIEVRNMIIKNPLDQYFIKGLKVLGLSE